MMSKFFSDETLVDKFVEAYTEKIFSESRPCERCGKMGSARNLFCGVSPKFYLLDDGVVAIQRVRCRRCERDDGVVCSDPGFPPDAPPEMRLPIFSHEARRCLLKVTHFEVLQDLMELLQVAAIDDNQDRRSEHTEIARFMFDNVRRVCEEWCRDEYADLRQKKYLRLYRETQVTCYADSTQVPYYRPSLACDGSSEYREMYDMMGRSFQGNRNKILCLLDLIKDTLIDRPTQSIFWCWVALVMTHVDRCDEFVGTYPGQVSTSSVEYKDLERRLMSLELPLGIRKIPVAFVLFEMPRFYHYLAFLPRREKGGYVGCRHDGGSKGEAPLSFLTEAEVRALRVAQREVSAAVMERKNSPFAPVASTVYCLRDDPKGAGRAESHTPKMLTGDEFKSELYDQIKSRLEPSVAVAALMKVEQIGLENLMKRCNEQVDETGKLRPPPLPGTASGVASAGSEPAGSAKSEGTQTNGGNVAPKSAVLVKTPSSSNVPTTAATTTTTISTPYSSSSILPSPGKFSSLTFPPDAKPTPPFSTWVTNPPENLPDKLRDALASLPRVTEPVDYMRFIVAEVDMEVLRRYKQPCAEGKVGTALLVASERGQVEHIVTNPNDIVGVRAYMCHKYQIFVPPEGDGYKYYVEEQKRIEKFIEDCGEEELRLLMMTTDTMTKEIATKRYREVLAAKAGPPPPEKAKADLKKRLKSSIESRKNMLSPRQLPASAFQKSRSGGGYIVPFANGADDLSGIPFTTNWTEKMMEYLDEYIEKGVKQARERNQRKDFDSDLEGDLKTISSIGFPMAVAKLSILELYRHALWTDTDEVFQKYNQEKKEREEEARMKREMKKMKKEKRWKGKQVELMDAAFSTVAAKQSGYIPEATAAKPPQAKTKASRNSREETKPQEGPNAQPAISKSAGAGVCDKTPSSLVVRDADPPGDNVPPGRVLSQATAEEQMSAGKKKKKKRSGKVGGEGEGGGGSGKSGDGGPCAAAGPSSKETTRDTSARGPELGQAEGTGDLSTASGGTDGEAKGRSSDVRPPAGHGEKVDKVDSRTELLSEGDSLPARVREGREDRERVGGCGDGGKLQGGRKGDLLEGTKWSEKCDESERTESKFQVQKSSDAIVTHLTQDYTSTLIVTPDNGPHSLKNNSTSGRLREVTNQEDVAMPATEGLSSGTLSPHGNAKVKKTARDKFKECENCHMEISDKIRVCSACKRVAYCNSNCQKEHWKLHKQACSHYLKKDVTG